MNNALTNPPILIVEGQEGKLAEEFRFIKKDTEVKRVSFAEAKKALADYLPRLAIISLDAHKEEAKEALRSFMISPKTVWAISAPRITTDELLEFMRLGANDFLQQPLSEDQVEKLIYRITGTAPTTSHIVSVFSAKGGVGVSFIAVNLAVEIAKENKGRVLLIDCVLQHGNVSDLLDQPCEFTLVDVVKNLERLDKKFLENSLRRHGSGVYILPRPKNPEDSERLTEIETADALRSLKNSFDYTVLDLGHEFDPVTITCLDQSDLIFLVTTPELPSLCNTSLALETFKKLGYAEDKVKLILNRCRMKGEINPALIEKNVPYPLSHQLAEETVLVPTSLNRGIPLVQLGKKSPLIKSFQQMTHSLPNGVKKEPVHGPS